MCRTPTWGRWCAGIHRARRPSRHQAWGARSQNREMYLSRTGSRRRGRSANARRRADGCHNEGRRNGRARARPRIRRRSGAGGLPRGGHNSGRRASDHRNVRRASDRRRSRGHNRGRSSERRDRSARYDRSRKTATLEQRENLAQRMSHEDGAGGVGVPGLAGAAARPNSRIRAARTWLRGSSNGGEGPNRRPARRCRR